MDHCFLTARRVARRTDYTPFVTTLAGSRLYTGPYAGLAAAAEVIYDALTRFHAGAIAY
jgi:hypothetical protein